MHGFLNSLPTCPCKNDSTILNACSLCHRLTHHAPSESTYDIMAGSLRTLAQLVPMAGGAVAQAWSEYEAIRQKQRTEEFFDQLREHMVVLERQHSDLRQKIESMPDAAELVEIAVAAAKRETSETKRAVYSRLYGNFLASFGILAF
jgi:hypothetical protein